MIDLYNYQQEAHDNTLRLWQRRHPYTNQYLSLLLHMATGTGKTEVISAILLTELLTGNLTRALYIAHTRELIHQPAQRWEKHWQELHTRSGIVMNRHNQIDAQIVVSTIQTLAASNYNRLYQMLQHGTFSHVVIDEAHHATAQTYRDVLNVLKDANQDLKILGATATPKRADGIGTGFVFDEISYVLTITDAIENLKALVEVIPMAVYVDLDPDNLTIGAKGDYTAESLGKLLNTKNNRELIITTWKEHAANRPTIVFTPTVRAAHDLCVAFKEEGIAAAMAHGDTPKEERDQILADYKAGKVQVLINCSLFTEGFDAPHTSCVLIARPTRSSVLMSQMIGRGTRLAEGKNNCIVLNCCPSEQKHDLIMVQDALEGRAPDEKIEANEEETLLALADSEVQQHEQKQGRNQAYIGPNVDPSQITIRMLDWFVTSKYNWQAHSNIMTLAIDNHTTMIIVLPDDARAQKARDYREAHPHQWTPAYETMLNIIESSTVWTLRKNELQQIGHHTTTKAAMAQAEDYANKYSLAGIASAQLANRNKPLQTATLAAAMAALETVGLMKQ